MKTATTYLNLFAFQYSRSNKTIGPSPTDYKIFFHSNYKLAVDNSTQCKLAFIHYTSHYKWIPTSVFYGDNPGIINEK